MFFAVTKPKNANETIGVYNFLKIKELFGVFWFLAYLIIYLYKFISVFQYGSLNMQYKNFFFCKVISETIFAKKSFGLNKFKLYNTIRFFFSKLKFSSTHFRSCYSFLQLYNQRKQDVAWAAKHMSCK